MLNAKLDPFDRKALSPSEMAGAFRIIRSNIIADELSAFPRNDDLSNLHDRVFFNPSDLPAAVLFISHRWATPSHPDPKGEQFAAVKTFLSFIRKFCSPNTFTEHRGKLSRFFSREPSNTKGNGLENLLTHGGFQAAYFLGDYNPFDQNGVSRRDLLELGRDVLNKVGVWYDYTSMPQAPAMRGELVAALERIHEFLGACNLVALRQPGDNYDGRAWCAAEVAVDPDVDRTRFRKICVRLDKIGETFPAELLLDQPPHWAEISEFTLNQLKGAQSGAEAARAVSNFIRTVGVDAEDTRDFPLFFVKRKPFIFTGQREFMSKVMNVLSQASKLDKTRGAEDSSFTIRVDIASAVSNAAKSAGLASSNEADIPYTSLLTIYARHRGAPALAHLYGSVMQRYLRGASTVLARYREDRTNQYDVKCLFRFEDEVHEFPTELMN